LRGSLSEGAIRYTQDYRLATRRREDLLLEGQTLKLADALKRNVPAAVWPIAQAAPGQCRRLQRL